MTASESTSSCASQLETFVLAPLGALLSSVQEREALSDLARKSLEERARRAKLLGDLSVGYAMASLKKILEADEPAPAPVEVVEDTPVAMKLELAPPVDDLVNDYDSLSASQVVALLDSLGSEERVRVRDYEASHRGRRTILGKIESLERKKSS